jgi:geranylgeranyl diphosphate synthase type II
LVEKELRRLLPETKGLEESVCEAMRYSVFAGGKKIRPVLLLAAYELCDGDTAEAVPAACALEMVHTYSLIHDDLPAMDDGQLRRGKPTTHKKFGEAIALLAGDALLTLAFEALSHCRESVVPKLVYELAHAAGTMGMIGGQVADIEWAGKEVEFPTLEYIHSHKTGALITASVRMGAIIAETDAETLKSLTGYGHCLGLAFQIADDIIDVESDSSITGKDSRADVALNKATYPRLFGVAESRRRCLGLIEQAKKHLANIGPRADMLTAIADIVGNRKA